MAVLQHLDRDDFHAALVKIAESLSPGGLFLFSMMEGDGDAWSEHKMDAPRHFVFWSEDGLVRALADARVELIQTWRPDTTHNGARLTFLARSSNSNLGTAPQPI